MINNLVDSDFEKNVLQADKPVLVTFWAEWCAPCTMMYAALESVAEKYGDKVDFYRINCDDNLESVEKYKVKGVPTTLFFISGKIAEEFVGLVPKEELETTIDFSL